LTHASHEEITLPGRKPIGCVKSDPGRCDRWNPEDRWLFEVRARRQHAWTQVIAPVADHGPTVVLSRAEDVDFVPAVRTVFALPHLACVRIECQPQLDAMTHRIDRWLVTRFVNERVVRRHASVIAKTENLSRVVVRVLRSHEADLWAGARSSNSHVQHSVFSKCDTRCFGIHVIRHENVAHIRQGLTVPRASKDGIATQVVRNWLVIRDVDPVVLRKTRMKGDVHQPFHRASRDDLRSAADRVWVESAVADKAKSSFSFSDEHGTVGKKRKTPGMRESFGHHDHSNTLFGGFEQERTIPERR